MNPVYIAALNPLRGIGALLVSVVHFQVLIAQFIPEGFSRIPDKSHLLVDMFFMMSGLIITHVYGQVFAQGISPVMFKHFVKARFARIYPLHFFTLLYLVLVFYSLSSPADPIHDPRAIPTHLLLLQSFPLHPIFTWNVPAWSISAEWWAYMAFPLLAGWLYRYRVSAYVCMLLFVLLAYLAIMYGLPRSFLFEPGILLGGDLNVTYDYGFLRGLAGFMIGMLLHELYNNKPIKEAFSKDWLALLYLVAVLMAMHMGFNDLFIMVLLAGLILCFSCNRGRLAAFCSNRVLQFLGDISYSVYLAHSLIIGVIMQLLLRMNLGYSGPGPGVLRISFWQGLLFVVPFLLVVVLISTLTYYLIEKPCRRYLNRL